jgi:hypothetical protein
MLAYHVGWRQLDEQLDPQQQDGDIIQLIQAHRRDVRENIYGREYIG